MGSYTAVVTTGIYCRAGCPATPLRRNTRPYSLAAAAEADGFRPCLRCRPDQLADTGWAGAPELVCRALRRITAGDLDGATEDDLAARLGVSARHLRRLFDEYVGATPGQVARSRRAHFARRLLDETDLPMAELGAAAGFTSVRQMNRVVKEVFGFTPSALRARRRRRDRSVVDGGLVLRLPYTPPLAWDALLAYLSARAIPGVEAVDLAAATYRRTISLDGLPGVIEVWPAGDDRHLLLRVHVPAFDDLVHVVSGVRRLFDLDTDPAPIDAHLARDRRLRGAVRRAPGVRVPGAYDPFECAVRAVVGQQVTVAGATRLAGRIAAAHGTPVAGVDGLGLTHVFPDAATLAGADLTGVGLTPARVAALTALAGAVDRDELALDGAAGHLATVTALRSVPGIGPWTAEYVAMRACGFTDALPSGDLGLRRALGAGDAAGVEAAAERWRPWRAYGALRCWTPPPAGIGVTRASH